MEVNLYKNLSIKMTNLCLKQMLSFAFLTDFKQGVPFSTYEPSHIQLLKPEIFTKSLYVYKSYLLLLYLADRQIHKIDLQNPYNLFI